MDRIPVAYELVTPPASEPVGLEQAKLQCRVDTRDEDETITGLIAVAREKVETDSERALISQTRRLYVDQFPNAGARGQITLNPFPSQPWLYGGAIQALEIGVKPISAINSVEYIDQTGAWVTWSSDNYIADLVTYPCRITPAYGLIWPICRVQINAVRITFTCGAENPALVPARAAQAMLLLIGHWYENREAVGNVGTEIALGYWSLIDSIRWH